MYKDDDNKVVVNYMWMELDTYVCYFYGILKINFSRKLAQE